MITESYFLMRPHLFCVLLVCYSAPRAGAPGRPPVVILAGAVYMSNGMTESLLMPLLSYRCQAEPGSSPPKGPAQSLTEAGEAVGRYQLQVGEGGEDRIIAEVSPPPTLPAKAS